MVTICTVVAPGDRPRLEAAGDGCFVAMHAESLREVVKTARTKRVDALVISVDRCQPDELPAVARFVRESPLIPTVALVSRLDHAASAVLLRLGASGVRAAVDCTEPQGWRRLRDLIGDPASPVAARILAGIVPALGDCSEEARIFFEAVARLPPALPTLRALARPSRHPPRTFMSGFRPAARPSPQT